MSFAEAAQQLHAAMTRTEQALGAVRGAVELTEQAITATRTAKERTEEAANAIKGAAAVAAEVHNIVAATYDGVNAGDELLRHIDALVSAIGEDAWAANDVMRMEQDDAVNSGINAYQRLDHVLAGTGLAALEAIRQAIARAQQGKA